MNQETSLIERAQRGDLQAYGSLVQQYQPIAYRTAYFITHDAHAADDATQEAFLRAHRALGSFQRGRPFRPWLIRIVTNIALDQLKADRRRGQAYERYLQEASMRPGFTPPEQDLAEREKSERLLQAVNRLAPEERTLIVLRYLVELPEADVAQAMNIPVGTVKSRLHRILEHLRVIIRREFPDLGDLTTGGG